MRKTALHYYEKEEYLRDAEAYATRAREVREKLISKYVPAKSANILELGCGSGVLKHLHPNWIGLDVSIPALKRARPSSVVACDIQKMPIRSETVDGIVSFNTLEHIEDPESVLEESSRVLSLGGVLLSQESWFCEFARTNSANLFQKVAVVTKRFAKELKLLLGAEDMKLRFRRIEPNYERVGEDWDAVSSLDPHEVFCWFRSRKFVSVNENRKVLLRCLKKQTFEDGEDVLVIRKPAHR